MIYLYGILAYLVVGFIITIVVGRTGGFDYNPGVGEFSPGVFKYMVLFCWGAMLALMLLGAIIFTPRFLNRQYNKLVNARVEPRRD